VVSAEVATRYVAKHPQAPFLTGEALICRWHIHHKDFSFTPYWRIYASTTPAGKAAIQRPKYWNGSLDAGQFPGGDGEGGF
jgi:hypothetical protein